MIALGYEIPYFAPGIFTYGEGIYIAAHNILKTHARVYHMYDEKFRATQNGKSKSIDGLIGMLLVSRSGLVEENAVELFHHYGAYLASSFLM